MAPSYCPGLSITTPQILHLACAISKSLAQARLRGSDVRPRSLTNDMTPVFHAKPPDKPDSLLLGARCFMGTAGCPAGTENALLCTVSTRLAGLTAAAGAALGCPSPCTAVRQQPPALPSSSVPPLGWLLQTLLGLEGARGGRDALPHRESVGKGGLPLGGPPQARSTARGWDPCARCRELVSPPASLQLLWAAGTCGRVGLGGRRAPALGAGAGPSVRQQGGAGTYGRAALPRSLGRGAQAAIRRGKDEVDTAGGIPGCEERSLLC